MFSGGVGLPIGTFFGVLINLLVQRVVPLFGLTEASWPTIITSAFLLVFIVLQSILAIASKTGGGIQLPPWLKMKRGSSLIAADGNSGLNGSARSNHESKVNHP